MLRFLYRRAQLQGLLGGSRAWTVLWVVLFGARMYKKVTTRDAKAVYSEVLQPGQAVVIRHEGSAKPGRR